MKSNQDTKTNKIPVIQSSLATDVVERLIPIWEKRKELHIDGGRTKKTLLLLETEFFLGAIAALDAYNKINYPDLKYSCLPPKVWVSTIRQESIAENLK